MKVTRIERSAMVFHSADVMFDLVNDIESYPQYMDGCQGATVLARTEQEIVARLDLARAGIKQSFTTRNVLTRPDKIELSLEEGPFKRLQGHWRFEALTESACKVSLILEFEFKSGIAQLAGSKLFSRVANNLVAATTERADVLARRTNADQEQSTK